MSKFHVNPETGDTGRCNAHKGGCPFGSVDEHFDTAEQARNFYEKTMTENSGLTKEKVNMKDKELISVLASNGSTLTEDFAKNLSEELCAGEYSGFYHDEKTNTDKYLLITVKESGEVNYHKKSDFHSTLSSSPVETQKKIRGFSKFLEEKKVTSLNYCDENNLDRIALLEGYNGVKNTLDKHNWEWSEDVVKGCKDLEKLQYEIQESIYAAEDNDREKEVNSLKECKSVVDDILNTIKYGKG